VIIDPTGHRRRLPSKVQLQAPASARLRIETPGGGGWGRATARRRPQRSG
jgi:N-methylhydantoinase B/oxoprolinase/acetone carboxylase alpha subunit